MSGYVILSFAYVQVKVAKFWEFSLTGKLPVNAVTENVNIVGGKKSLDGTNSDVVV